MSLLAIPADYSLFAFPQPMGTGSTLARIVPYQSDSEKQHTFVVHFMGTGSALARIVPLPCGFLHQQRGDYSLAEPLGSAKQPHGSHLGVSLQATPADYSLLAFSQPTPKLGVPLLEWLLFS